MSHAELCTNLLLERFYGSAFRIQSGLGLGFRDSGTGDSKS